MNGEKKVVASKMLSFDRDCRAGVQSGPPTGHKHLCSRSPMKTARTRTRTGSLLEGGTVKIKDGMIFNVTPTDKS